MKKTVEGRLDRIESKLKGLRQAVDELMGMMETVVATQNEMRGVREWQKAKASQRKRTQKCRTKARDQTLDYRKFTVKNKDKHSLKNDIGKVRWNSVECPGVHKGMLNVMKGELGKQDPNLDPHAWFVQQVDMHRPDYVIEFLVCLYNRSFWVPWVTPSGEKWSIFSEWKNAKDDASKAVTTTENKMFLTIKTDPPAKWEDSAFEKFQEAAIWKVFEVLYAFLSNINGLDLEHPSRNEFWRLVALMSSSGCSQYTVYQDLEWSLQMLADQDRPKALKIYGRVCDRLKILQNAFVRGLSKSYDDLKQYFTVPE